MRILADYYVHNLDPYIFRIGGFGPRYYGVAYLMGFLFAYLLIGKLSRRGMLRLNPERVPDLVLNCCIFGVLIGGRLGYVLFYDLPIRLNDHMTPLLWDFSSNFPYWGVLRVNDGGMSAHGGIVFTILTLMVFAWNYVSPRPPRRKVVTLVIGVFIFGAAGYLPTFLLFHDGSYAVGASLAAAVGWMAFYGWRNAIPVTNIGDVSCMVVPVGLFFGRIANFINGELYGHPTTMPWAVKFPSEIYAPTNGIIDSGVKEKLYDTMNGLGLYTEWNNDNDALNHLGIMLREHNAAAIAAVAKIIPARHPSQLYEALLEGILLFIICWCVGWYWRKEGMASGAFLTFYPVMRIIGEQFRVGDTPAHIFGMEISKGVMYSLPMILGGAIYWGYFIKRSKPNQWVPPPLPSPEPETKTLASDS